MGSVKTSKLFANFAIFGENSTYQETPSKTK